MLIVEDNKHDVFLIREALTSAQIDAEIQVVNDGAAAAEFLDAVDRDAAAPRPDVVLLDLNLPKMNGDEVLKHLRNSTRSKEARVLIVTSSTTQRDRDNLRNLGADGYFSKPSDYEEFLKLGALVKQLL